MADKHVTRYLVRLRNELSTSSVKCSRDDRWSIKDITRNPRFCKKNIKEALEKRGSVSIPEIHGGGKNLTWIICCCTVWELSTNSHINPNNLELCESKVKRKQKIEKYVIQAENDSNS